jgi:hypothetical protein
VPVDSSSWRFEFGDPGSLLPPSDFVLDVLPAFVVFGVGLMIMVAPLTTALMRSVPVRHSGVASAFNNAVSRVGPQLAGALLFVVISSSFYAELADRSPGLDTTSPEVREQITPLNPVPASVGEEVVAAAEEASTDAFHIAMLVAALMCFAGAAANAVGIRNPARDRVPPERHAVTPCPQSPPVEASGA